MKTQQSIKADYGQDMSGIVYFSLFLGIIFLVASVLLYQRYQRSDILGILAPAILAASLAIIFFVITVSGIWSSKKGKLILRDKVLNNLHFSGNETILDIGCGKGLLLIAAAKRIPEGHAIGGDIWAKTVEYNYTAQMVLSNAKIEGVSDRVETVYADVQELPFADRSFDIVMTSLMMHHVKDVNKAITEMVRVTKPGGVILIADVNSKRFLPLFKAVGLQEISLYRATRLFLIPANIIMGKRNMDQ